MSIIITRSGKGSPLTHAEMDANLTNLNNDKLDVSTADSIYATKDNPSLSGTLTHSGNVNFSGTGQRITSDFSNATVTSRTLFQTSTTNANTIIGVLPSATTTGNSALSLYGHSDPVNSPYLKMTAQNNTGVASLESGKTGTGTYIPITFYTGGSERMRIDTGGNIGIKTNNPAGYALNIGQTSNALRIGDSVTDSSTLISLAGNGYTGTVGMDATGLSFGHNSPSRVISFLTASVERFRFGGAGQLGIGGANYGTTGQVLISGGPASAPSWGTATGGAKAWVNFDGTASGTIAPRSNLNITSVTKLSTGAYTLNITGGVLADANYAAVGGSNSYASNGTAYAGGLQIGASTKTTTALSVLCFIASGPADASQISIAIFGN